jgi:hypothetical protein
VERRDCLLEAQLFALPLSQAGSRDYSHLTHAPCVSQMLASLHTVGIVGEPLLAALQRAPAMASLVAHTMHGHQQASANSVAALTALLGKQVRRQHSPPSWRTPCTATSRRQPTRWRRSLRCWANRCVATTPSKQAGRGLGS